MRPLLERAPAAAGAAFDRAIELARAVHNRMVLGVAGSSDGDLPASSTDPD